MKTAGTKLEVEKSVRIINVSSTAHRWITKLNLDDLTFERDPSDNKILNIYGITKLCNVLFSKELAKKLEPFGEFSLSLIFHARWMSIPIFNGGMKSYLES